MKTREGKERKESPTGVPTTLFRVLPLLFLAFFTPRHSLLSERLEQATLGLSLYPISLFPFGEIRSSCNEGFFPSFLFHPSKQGIKCELFTYSPQGLYDIHVKLQGVPLLGWEAPVMAVGMNAR